VGLCGPWGFCRPSTALLDTMGLQSKYGNSLLFNVIRGMWFLQKLIYRKASPLETSIGIFTFNHHDNLLLSDVHYLLLGTRLYLHFFHVAVMKNVIYMYYFVSNNNNKNIVLYRGFNKI